jgi:hypothetical protein
MAMQTGGNCLCLVPAVVCNGYFCTSYNEICMYLALHVFIVIHVQYFSLFNNILFVCSSKYFSKTKLILYLYFTQLLIDINISLQVLKCMERIPANISMILKYWYLLFMFQTNVEYKITGLSNAPDYFSIDRSTGEVRVKANLRDDSVRQTVYRVKY